MRTRPSLLCRQLTTGIVATGLLVAAAVASASPADAAGGVAVSLTVTPATAGATSGQCVTFTVTERAADRSRATSGQFTPTVTLGGNTLASYGTPVAGPVLGLPPACTDSTVSASGTSGSVFTFGVVTTDLLGIPQTTTITIANADGSISTAATETVGSASSTTPDDASLGFGAPTTTLGESCPTSTTDPMTATTGTQEVCARVTTNNGLQGVGDQAVTFTVDKGSVAGTATDATAATATTTYRAVSDGSGVATAFVSSGGPGPQNIVAEAGTGDATVTSNGLVDTYQGANPAGATLSMTPQTATIASGGSQRFTVTVDDSSGTGLGGVPVDFQVQGSGSIAGGITAERTTGSDGTAVVTVSTQVGDTAAGSGSLTASAPTPAGTTATSTATSSYTILAQAPTKVSTTLALSSTSKHRLREVATLHPKLGTVTVDFYTVRHGKRTYVGKAVTNAKGVATFTLTHLTSGSTVTATARPVKVPKHYALGAYATARSHKIM